MDIKDILLLTKNIDGKKKIGIYMIHCLGDNKIYIGQSKNIGNRWSIHRTYLKQNRHANSYLQSAYNKYGMNMFSFHVLEECGKEQLNDREVHWISLIDSKNLFNISSGGDQQPVSEETRRKISIAIKGKKRSEFTKELLRLANKDKILTEEHKRKISESQKGKPGRQSFEARKALSEKMKGNTFWKMKKDFTLSGETKDKISQSHLAISAQKSEQTKSRIRNNKGQFLK